MRWMNCWTGWTPQLKGGWHANEASEQRRLALLPATGRRARARVGHADDAQPRLPAVSRWT
jgi:hypothetical protein